MNGGRERRDAGEGMTVDAYKNERHVYIDMLCAHNIRHIVIATLYKEIAVSV